jgi:hypothetical protein
MPLWVTEARVGRPKVQRKVVHGILALSAVTSARPISATVATSQFCRINDIHRIHELCHKELSERRS